MKADNTAPKLLLEQLLERIFQFLHISRFSLMPALVSGFLAHGFCFTNKFINHDEIYNLFGKGATVDSGRWGLGALDSIFPNYSMPWIHGILTIVLIAAGVCLIAHILEIRNPLLQALLGGAIVVFPLWTSTFSFMFTSSSYAVAFLLAVLSVWVFVNVKKRPVAWLISCLMLIFSVGIYQAYIAIAASFFVLLMVQRLMEQNDAAKVFRFGVGCVAMMGVSLVVYYAIAFMAVKLSGGEFLVYAVEQETGILFRIALAYNGFIKALTSGYYGFVDTGLSFVSHLLGVALCIGFGIRELIVLKENKKRILFLVCIVLLPLSMNCLFLISTTQIIHSLVLYSFISLYVLAAILLDRAEGVKLLWLRDVVVICLLLTVVSNVFTANKVYLKLHLQYEQAYAFYS